MSHLTYRIVDTLSKTILLTHSKTPLCLSLALGRADSNADEYEDCGSYLVYDQKEKSKTRYVLKVVDLEKLTNLSEFIVCPTKNDRRCSFAQKLLVFLERHLMVQATKSSESDVPERLFSDGYQTASCQTLCRIW